MISFKVEKASRARFFMMNNIVKFRVKVQKGNEQKTFNLKFKSLGKQGEEYPVQLCTDKEHLALENFVRGNSETIYSVLEDDAEERVWDYFNK